MLSVLPQIRTTADSPRVDSHTRELKLINLSQCCLFPTVVNNIVYQTHAATTTQQPERSGPPAARRCLWSRVSVHAWIRRLGPAITGNRPLTLFLCVAGRVFVTYEADNDKHVNEIINFVALLRHNGFDTHVRAVFGLFILFHFKKMVQNQLVANLCAGIINI